MTGWNPIFHVIVEKKKKSSFLEEKKNTSGEKWLVTFSDLMSLLFALFVLLISFAEVDAEKFKANSAKLANAFNKEEPTFNITQIKKDKN